MQTRLAGWQARTLSKAGRVTLIKSVLNSMPIYFLGVFCAPKVVLDRFEKLQRAFLWAGKEGGRYLALAKWKQLQLSHKKGGLGLGSIRLKNKALLCKWIWRFHVEGSPLWKKVIVSIHECSMDNLLGKNGRQQKGSVWNELVYHIMSDEVAWGIVTSSMRWSVGNGNTWCFWEDAWCEGHSLATLYPRLYSVSTQRGCRISEVGVLVGDRWEWGFAWRRQLFVYEEDQLGALRDMLTNVRGSTHFQDRCSWVLSPDGLYTSFSFRVRYEEVTCTTIQNLSSVWRGLAIPKAELLTWFALQSKLNVRHRLVRVGMLTVDRDRCPFCNEHDETVNHVLLHCRNVWLVWSDVCNWWGVSWVAGGTLMDLYDWWMGARWFGFQRKLWQSIFYSVVWSVWQVRNNVVFTQVVVDWQELSYLIKLRVGFWVKRWCPEFSYSPTTVVANIVGVRLWHARRRSPV